MSIENVKGSFTKKELFVIFSENHESTLFSSLVLSEGFSGKLENYFSSKNSLVDIFKFRLLLKILKFFRKVNDSYDHPDKSVPKLKLIESLIVKFIESSKNKNALVYLLSFYSSSVNFTRLYLENKNVLWLEDLSKFEIRKLYKSVADNELEWVLDILDMYKGSHQFRQKMENLLDYLKELKTELKKRNITFEIYLNDIEKLLKEKLGIINFSYYSVWYIFYVYDFSSFK
jgi:hypothetical protein